MSVRPEDLEEFVREGIRSDEELLWFSRPHFGAVWKHEISAPLTKGFLWLSALILLANLLAFGLGEVSTVLLILLVPALGGLIFRLGWIWYLSRRLTYVITTSRLLFLLEAARPIDFKSFSLSAIGKVERLKNENGREDIRLPDHKEHLFGITEAGKAVGFLTQTGLMN